jgi:hypothetical protein
MKYYKIIRLQGILLAGSQFAINKGVIKASLEIRFFILGK